MKAIINLYAHKQDWCDELFPSRSLCTLPVAGKPLAEYLIDECSEEGVTDVLVLDYNYNVEFAKKLLEGHRWPLEVRYEGADIVSDMSVLLSRKSAFIGSDEVLVYWGASLPKHVSLEELLKGSEAVQLSSGMEASDGVYIYKDGELRRSEVSVRSVNTIQEYFDINFEMLKNPGGYILSGYSSENEVYTGMNVVLKQDVEINAPVMLCDDICLERGCKLSNGVIIGHESLIDKHTVLRHSVILDHTFLGRDIELEDKIVDSARIIDPRTDAYMDQDDMGIASDLRHFHVADWRDGFEYMLALILVLIFLVPYCVYWIFRKKLTRNGWNLKLSADRYPTCIQVLFGRARLIKQSSDDRTPCVFCASDSFSMSRDEEQRKLDDIYYQHHRNVWSMLVIVYKGLISRLFIHTNERSNA